MVMGRFNGGLVDLSVGCDGDARIVLMCKLGGRWPGLWMGSDG